MALVKRILAGVVLVISALLLVASVAGLIGIWAVNTPITNALLNLLAAADRPLEVGAQALGRAQSQLTALQTRLDGVQTKLGARGSSAGDDARALDEIKGAAHDTLGPQARQVSEATEAARERVEFVQQIAQALRPIPGAGIQAPDAEPVGRASKTAAELAALADQLNAQVAAITELRQDTAASVQSSLAAISGRVATLEQQLNAAAQSIESARNNIASAEASIPTWIDLLSLAATLVALVAALAFASLCMQAWGVLSGRGQPAIVPQHEPSAL